MWLKVWYIFYGIRTKSSEKTPRTKSPLGQIGLVNTRTSITYYVRLCFTTSSPWNISHPTKVEENWPSKITFILSRKYWGEFCAGDFVLERYFTNQNPHWKTVYLFISNNVADILQIHLWNFLTLCPGGGSFTPVLSRLGEILYTMIVLGKDFTPFESFPGVSHWGGGGGGGGGWNW